MTYASRFTAAVVVLALVVACSGDRGASGDTTSAASATSSGVALTGAGATFPHPIYYKWFSDYADETRREDQLPVDRLRRRHPAAVSEGTVDFGATDSPMTDEEIAERKGRPDHAHPDRAGRRRRSRTTSPASRRPLKLTGERSPTSSSARSRKWNDARIAALNPGVDTAASGHSRRASLRRERHDLHLHGLPRDGRARRGPGRQAGARRSSGRSESAPRATRASRAR